MLKLLASAFDLSNAAVCPPCGSVGIDVFRNEEKVGSLVVPTEHADELVTLLNATGEMRDACRACEQAMRDLLMAGYKSDNLWVNLSAAQRRAHATLATLADAGGTT